MKKIIVLLFAGSVLIFSGCKSGSGGGDPKEVLVHFFDAIAKKDIEGAKKYVTKDSEGMLDMVKMGMNSVPDSANFMYGKENMEIGDAVVDGDRATVPVKDKKSGEATDFTLKKEDGNWKVAFDKSTLMEMAQKKMHEKGINPGLLDSAGLHNPMEKLKNLSKEDMEKAKLIMDSASKMLQKMKDNGQLEKGQKMLDSVSKMMEKMKNQ